MKISVLYGFIILTFLSCRNKVDQKPAVTKKKPIEIEIAPPAAAKRLITYSSKIMKIKDVRINGHQVILPTKKFQPLYKIDSSKTELWECGDPFEFIDEAWMKKTYGNKNEEKGTFENYDSKVTTLFGKGIKFNTNSHIVLFNTAFASSNSFEIPSHHLVLNEHTSLKDFQKIFPTAVMEKLEDPNEVRFRFYIERNIDDAFLFYFKNGKLNYFSLWWLLC